MDITPSEGDFDGAPGMPVAATLSSSKEKVLVTDGVEISEFDFHELMLPLVTLVGSLPPLSAASSMLSSQQLSAPVKQPEPAKPQPTYKRIRPFKYTHDPEDPIDVEVCHMLERLSVKEKGTLSLERTARGKYIVDGKCCMVRWDERSGTRGLVVREVEKNGVEKNGVAIADMSLEQYFQLWRANAQSL